MKQDGGMGYPSNSKASEKFGSNAGSLRKMKTPSSFMDMNSDPMLALELDTSTRKDQELRKLE